jgi:hypothetical protein
MHYMLILWSVGCATIFPWCHNPEGYNVNLQWPENCLYTYMKSAIFVHVPCHFISNLILKTLYLSVKVKLSL